MEVEIEFYSRWLMSDEWKTDEKKKDVDSGFWAEVMILILGMLLILLDEAYGLVRVLLEFLFL